MIYYIEYDISIGRSDRWTGGRADGRTALSATDFTSDVCPAKTQTYTDIHIYIYIYVYLMYMYIYICTCMYVYM